MKILGISGSPHRGGNSETMLDRALRGAKHAGAAVEKVVLSEISLEPCRGCNDCLKTGECRIKDEMRRIYRKVDAADGLIVASPVYFGSLSAQTKMMIDRFQPYWFNKHASKNRLPDKKHRKGIFLCAAGTGRISFFKNSESIIRIFFATLGIDYSGSVFYGDSDKASLRRRLGALKRSLEAGEKLVKKLCYE